MNKPILFASLLSLAFVTGLSGVSAQGYDDYDGSRGSRRFGPGSGTGTGRDFGPGSGTGMGRCRPVRVKVCSGGAGDGRGPRCRIERQLRC